MRDVILALIMVGILPTILWRPWFGAIAWAWVSMMNPHSMTYGFAQRVPWAMLVAAFTLVALVINKDRKPLPSNGGTWLMVALLLWMGLTSFFAINQNPGEVSDRWLFAFKVFFMLFVTLMLLRGRNQIDWLIWAMVISVDTFGVKGGLWTLATGGGGRVYGPPGGTLSDNNGIAIGLVITLPWMYYLREVATNRWVRMGLMISMVLCAFAILGTQSRGAFLAVTSMAIVLGWKSKNFIRTVLGLTVVGLLALAFMPESWTARMDTMNRYEADGSAMSRIWTWKTLWAAALDRPLVGAGFRADNFLVFQKYAPVVGFEQFQGLVFVAHSIYLQALGEHGFVGLGLYLCLGFWTWFTAGSLSRKTRDDPEFGSWVPLLMRMTQASLVGFAVGGAFLSMMLVDITYYMPGIVILVQATVAERRSRPAAMPAVPAKQ